MVDLGGTETDRGDAERRKYTEETEAEGQMRHDWWQSNAGRAQQKREGRRLSVKVVSKHLLVEIALALANLRRRAKRVNDWAA